MRICAILGVALILVSCTTARRVSQSPLGTSDYASPVYDPLEGFNRGVQEFNGCFNNCVVYPASSLYRFATPACLRRGLMNFSKNLAYPVRALNNCFQGKFGFAWDETKRFGINTTIGVPSVSVSIICMAAPALVESSCAKERLAI